MAAEFLVHMGERLRERREEMGLSRSDVARLMPGKVSENQIYRWELGKHQPNPDTLEALAAVLKRPVSYFMTAPADKTTTPSPFDAPASIEQRLEHIEQQLDQLLSLFGGKPDAAATISDAIAAAVDRALNRRATEVGRPRRSPPRPQPAPAPRRVA